MSNPNKREEVKSTAFERHGQTIIATLALLILLGVGKTVLDTKFTQGKIEVNVANISKTVFEINKQVKDLAKESYKIKDAEKDFEEVWGRIVIIEGRLERIDREQALRGPRIDQLEDKDDKR